MQLTYGLVAFAGLGEQCSLHVMIQLQLTLHSASMAKIREAQLSITRSKHRRLRNRLHLL
jgi:hypothetical protein